MKKSNRQFEETGAFLDLMTKKEKKHWEQSQAKKTVAKKKVEHDNNLEINPTDNLEAIAETLTTEEKALELEKTKKLLNITQEITPPDSLKEHGEHNLDTNILINPIVPIGLALILIFVSFIYLALFTKYNHSTFLIINSVILFFFTICFGVTILSNKKHVKAFAIFDLIMILIFVIFNGISITNYHNIYDKGKPNTKTDTNSNENIIKNPTNKEEDTKVITNRFICHNNNETIEITILEEDNYITFLKRSETFNDASLAQKTSQFYADIAGINVDIDELMLTLEFDFNILTINQYKMAVENHNSYHRLETDFSYIENNRINYTKYINVEGQNLTCKQVEK